MALLLAIQLPLAASAQDGTDRVTGFARDRSMSPLACRQKVAVSFALFVEEFGFGQGPVYRPDLAPATRTS